MACPHVLANKHASPSLRYLGCTVPIPVLPRHRNGAPPSHSTTYEVLPGLLQFTPYRQYRHLSTSANPIGLCVEESTICTPHVGWLTGKLLSVPDERPSGGGEDKKVKYMYQSTGVPEATLNMHTRRTQNGRLSNNSSTSTLRQRGLNSNILKIGTANYINNSTPPSPQILCSHTHHASDLYAGINQHMNQHSPCLCARHDNVHPKRTIRTLPIPNKPQIQKKM